MKKQSIALQTVRAKSRRKSNNTSGGDELVLERETSPSKKVPTLSTLSRNEKEAIISTFYDNIAMLQREVDRLNTYDVTM